MNFLLQMFNSSVDENEVTLEALNVVTHFNREIYVITFFVM